MGLTSAFKPCDVRGPYPEVVNERLFRGIGAALAGQHPQGSVVVLAGDLRASTPALLEAVWEGLCCPWATVLHPVATPIAYFVARELGADLTLVVTASHNPPVYNGLKILGRQGRPPSESDLRDLEAHAMALLDRPVVRSGPPPVAPIASWLDRYCQAVVGLSGEGDALRVVVDPGNGCLCGVAADALRQAGHQVVEINGRPDGGFPARGADPTVDGALAQLAAEVAKTGAHLGVAFDGDGDRVVFVDEAGSVVPGDVAAALLALESSGRCPGAPVILDVRTSRRLAAALEARGARVVWSYPGHALIRARLLAHGAAFGGEISGHYFFAELGGDDGLYAAMRMCRLVAREGPLSRLAADLPRGYTLTELRLPFVGAVDRVLEALVEAFPDAGAQRQPAGLTLEWEGQWVLVRPSITEPLLTIRGESSSEEGLLELAQRLDGVLRRFGLRLT